MSGVVAIRPIRILGAAVERLEWSTTTDKSPEERQVGHQKSCGALSDVPICPFAPKRLCEGVVLVKNGAKDDEESKTKDSDKCSLFLSRQLSSDEQWQGNDHEDKIGRNVKGCVGDEVVDSSAALYVRRWDCPVWNMSECSIATRCAISYQ